MITASEAYVLARQSTPEKQLQEELNNIEKIIRREAEQGKFELILKDAPSPKAIRILSEYRFDVVPIFTSVTSRNFRLLYCKIRWDGKNEFA